MSYSNSRDKVGEMMGGGLAGCGCALILAKIGLIIAVIYILYHFISKCW